MPGGPIVRIAVRRREVAAHGSQLKCIALGGIRPSWTVSSLGLFGSAFPHHCQPVIVLRCTRRLLAHLPKAERVNGAESTAKLGDWYANLIRFRERRLALCTNERTLLSVVVPVAPSRAFLERFRAAALHRLRQLPVPASLRLAESAPFAELTVAPTRSRSVLASMNQLGWGAEVWLRERPDGDLEELGLWLCDTPMSALQTYWPWKEAVFLLTGVRPPEVGKTGPRDNAT